MSAVVAATGAFATTSSAQTSTSPTGPAFSWRFFTTALENDPSRDVRMQMQLHLPSRQGNAFHTHNGDQWEVVVEGEITFTVARPGAESAQGGRVRLYPARHGPSQREQEQCPDPDHRAPDHGQGQAAEQSCAVRPRAGRCFRVSISSGFTVKVRRHGIDSTILYATGDLHDRGLASAGGARCGCTRPGLHQMAR